MPKRAWLEGGCHCEAVRFRARLGEADALDCNCSICSMKAYIHLFVPPEDFELLSGEGALATYRFGTLTAAHTFCSVCGVAPFYTPRSHPDSVDINARCLDDDHLAKLNVVPFDGANWEHNVQQIRGQ